MPDVKFAHFTIPVPTYDTPAAATVAAIETGYLVADNDKPAWPLWRIGVALCSPEDNFCRREGRTRAIRKLFGTDPAQYCSGLRERDNSLPFTDWAEIVVREVINRIQEERDLDKDFRWYDLLTNDFQIESRPNKPNRVKRRKNA